MRATAMRCRCLCHGDTDSARERFARVDAIADHGHQFALACRLVMNAAYPGKNSVRTWFTLPCPAWACDGLPLHVHLDAGGFQAVDRFLRTWFDAVRNGDHGPYFLLIREPDNGMSSLLPCLFFLSVTGIDRDPVLLHQTLIAHEPRRAIDTGFYAFASEVFECADRCVGIV